jgi:hypothetical protein
MRRVRTRLVVHLNFRDLNLNPQDLNRRVFGGPGLEVGIGRQGFEPQKFKAQGFEPQEPEAQAFEPQASVTPGCSEARFHSTPAFCAR